MRCKYCGKKNDETAVVCSSCGQFFDEKEKEKAKIQKENISLLMVMWMIHLVAGFIFLILAIKGGYVFLIASSISFINFAVYLSIDSRLSRLEESHHLKREKNG